MRPVIAIDPGVSGGFCAYHEDGRIDLYRWEGRIEAASMADQWARYWSGTDVVIEQVHASPAMSQSSAFTFGQNFGEWLGILAAVRISPVIGVTPQSWQRKYEDQLRGLQGSKRKSALLKIAKALYPELPVTLATCDALLIADHVRSSLSEHPDRPVGKIL